MNPQSLFKYTFIDNSSSKTIFLFHGTGGDETDFLFLNEQLDKKYNLVGLKGNVDENGMNRFFRRVSLGVFDQENIKEEVEKLRVFISEWMKTNNVTVENTIFLGYSNGANILLAFLFYHPELINNALLLHPMLPFGPKEKLDLESKRIFLAYGTRDSMVSLEESNRLIHLLKSYNAQVTTKEYSFGHEITNSEVADAVEYLRKM